jgi:hypothetical protein
MVYSVPSYLRDADGAYLRDADGAYLVLLGLVDAGGDARVPAGGGGMARPSGS